MGLNEVQLLSPVAHRLITTLAHLSILGSYRIDGEELGEGTASVVYKGKYRGQQVAIKILKETIDGKHKEDFEKELQVIR